jgi:hypothetical protein
MNIKKNILVTLLLVSNAVMAQTPDMATAMRANGKIYVVVGVLSFLLFVRTYCFCCNNRDLKRAAITQSRT